MAPADPPPPAADKPKEPEAPEQPAQTQEFWPSLISRVRQNRKLISAWVESGALTGIQGDVVLVGFPSDQAFAMDFLHKSHRGFLEEIASELLGRPVTMRFSLQEGLVVQPTPPEPEKPAAPPVDHVADFKNDPLIRRALELFRAEIQPV